MRVIDNYCERLGPEFWAEPANAVTNAAFLAAALACWLAARRAGRSGDPAIIALCAIIAAIGIGSFLFHTFATPWSGAADVIPILIFILTYLHFSVTRWFALPRRAGFAAVIGFFPAAIGLGWVIGQVFGPLNGSAGYGAVLALILICAGLLARRGLGGVARGWAVGAGIFLVSLTFRTLDDQTGSVCAAFPLGTHWLWHCFNGLLLGWMTLLMIRRGAPGEAQGGAGVPPARG